MAVTSGCLGGHCLRTAWQRGSGNPFQILLGSNSSIDYRSSLQGSFESSDWRFSSHGIAWIRTTHRYSGRFWDGCSFDHPCSTVTRDCDSPSAYIYAQVGWNISVGGLHECLEASSREEQCSISMEYLRDPGVSKPVLRISLMKENPGRRFSGCVYYDVQDECTFCQWADFDSDPISSDLGKLMKRLELLKLRVSSYKRHLYVLLIFGIVGWFFESFVWFHGLSSGRCSGFVLDY
ncbi:hypothetical protein PIB30_072937 [Stylosanthes scabra]|uniref:Zinc finger GRF-type domain-containing protein n=1 Tax=Stylosanthes scabra TaxID=79078 RepID=A0ABU6QNT8_9FABA|nr:hypothetical protein [Stylosanthes scabra]